MKAITHRSDGRQARTPPAIPAANAKAAQSTGCLPRTVAAKRDLNWLVDSRCGYACPLGNDFHPLLLADQMKYAFQVVGLGK